MNITIQQSAKAEVFTTLFQNMKHFSEHINVQFTPEHMYIQTMDSARISILEVKLPKKWFTTYTCEQSIVLGVPSQILYKILATRDKDQSIQIHVEDSNTDTLLVDMCSIPGKNKTGCFERHFVMPLMDIEMDCVQVPDLEYQVEMCLSATIFTTMIHQLRGFGDNLRIHCNEEQNQWTSTTQENGSMSVEVNIDDLHEFEIEENCDLTLEFALQYLQNVGAYSKISKNMTVKMHADYPLRLDFPLEDDGYIIYYLAPKINED